MAVMTQELTDNYAVYNGDCMEVMPGLSAGSIDLSVYSPPFAGLYHYSSSPRDLSNARSYEEFMEHYGFVVREIHRITKPGRITAVHCADVALSNTGRDAIQDFPGDIIRLHQRFGWDYVSRRAIWKEPLWVRNRTLVKGLAHRTIVESSEHSAVAGADYLLAFRKRGASDCPTPPCNRGGFLLRHFPNWDWLTLYDWAHDGEWTPPADVFPSVARLWGGIFEAQP